MEPAYFCEHAGAAGNNDGSCQSITGGIFVDSPSWPAPYRGRYFFGDNANGNVWTLTPNAARDGFVSSPRSDFGTGFGTPIRFLVGPDGNLYVGNVGGNIVRHLAALRRGRRDPRCGHAGCGHGPTQGRPTPVLRMQALAMPVRRSTPGPFPSAVARPRAASPVAPRSRGRRRAGPATRARRWAPSSPYMPWDSWAATMMANAIRDPLYQAALSVANQDVLGIGQWCLRCHSPSSYVQGHGLPPDGSALDAVDRAGVSCEACHRTRTDAGVLIGNAQLDLRAELPGARPLRLGREPGPLRRSRIRW